MVERCYESDMPKTIVNNRLSYGLKYVCVLLKGSSTMKCLLLLYSLPSKDNPFPEFYYSN